MALDFPRLGTVTEVSDSLSVSKSTVIRWINEGTIEGYQFNTGGDYRIDLDDLQQKLELFKVKPDM